MEWASTRILLHVTCQSYTQNVYMTQHFKIKGNYAVKHCLKLHNVSLNAEICRQKETVKPLNKYFYYFQGITCRWIATLKKGAVGESLQERNITENKKPRRSGVQNWSAREDSNLRPTGPKPVALPSCATRRCTAFWIFSSIHLKSRGARGGTRTPTS